MPLGSRISLTGVVYYATTRTNNNNEPRIVNDADYRKFLNLLARYRAKLGFELHAYAILPNRSHILLKPSPKAAISTIMASLNMAYARHYNRTYDGQGHVWGPTFSRSIVEPGDYTLEAMSYIEMVPVLEGLVEHPADYPWTSYACHAQGKACEILDLPEEYLKLAKGGRKRQEAYREYVEKRLKEDIDELDPATTRSEFIASEEFRNRVTDYYDEKIWPKQRRILERLRKIRSDTAY